MSALVIQGRTYIALWCGCPTQAYGCKITPACRKRLERALGRKIKTRADYDAAVAAERGGK